jgi:catechol O-methyltransferase
VTEERRREDDLAEYVAANAPAGDPAAAARAIDEFCERFGGMMNVGEEKGSILDSAVRATSARMILELGAYCGYSSLRMAAAADPTCRIVSVEISPDNAAVARRNHQHAGVADRIEIVLGSIGDGGATMDALETEHGFDKGSVDLVFVDHEKDACVSDLQLIVARGWPRRGAVVVADNIVSPGIPGYEQYMAEREGTEWRTVRHDTAAAYNPDQRDAVLVSEYLG